MPETEKRDEGTRPVAVEIGTTAPDVTAAGSPPRGQEVELPGRGVAFVRDVPGPPGAPTVFLLHGLTASADLNWAASLPSLARYFRVVAFDQRGHGRGRWSQAGFSLEEGADDVAALAEALGVERAIVVGYSMGGVVAQLVWRHHRDLVAGLVLCATARNFLGTPLEQLLMLAGPGLVAATLFTPPPFRLGPEVLGAALFGRRLDARLRRWMISEMRRADVLAVVQAAQAVSRFTSHQWIGDVDVPTGVVVTTRDRVVPPNRQMKLARAIVGASVHPVDGDHGSCLTQADLFVPALVEACRSVADRAASEWAQRRDGSE